jgi:hypothetical protein
MTRRAQPLTFPVSTIRDGAAPPHPALERHYSVAEVAAIWALSDRTVKRMFEDERGVLAWVNKDSGKLRRYRTLRIPESVLVRVYERLRQR